MKKIIEELTIGIVAFVGIISVLFMYLYDTTALCGTEWFGSLGFLALFGLIIFYAIISNEEEESYE